MKKGYAHVFVALAQIFDTFQKRTTTPRKVSTTPEETGGKEKNVLKVETTSKKAFQVTTPRNEQWILHRLL